MIKTDPQPFDIKQIIKEISGKEIVEASKVNENKNYYTGPFMTFYIENQLVKNHFDKINLIFQKYGIKPNENIILKSERIIKRNSYYENEYNIFSLTQIFIDNEKQWTHSLKCLSQSGDYCSTNSSIDTIITSPNYENTKNTESVLRLNNLNKEKFRNTFDFNEFKYEIIEQFISKQYIFCNIFQSLFK